MDGHTSKLRFNGGTVIKFAFEWCAILKICVYMVATLKCAFEWWASFKM